jgi:hypothetical protein
MVYSDTTNSQGIVQDIYFGISQNATSYPIADVTRSVNNGLDRISAVILKADNRWQWDDTNNTTLPIATTDINSGQQDYLFDSSFLEVDRVIIADTSGNFAEIYNIDIHDQTSRTYVENNSGNTGVPYRYDVLGNSILLDPVPNYSRTGALKVYFKRKAQYFTANDTTKVPGFAPQFHKYLSLYAQYEYAHAKGLDKREVLMRDILAMEKEVEKFYSRRLKDYRPRFISRIRDPR